MRSQLRGRENPPTSFDANASKCQGYASNAGSVAPRSPGPQFTHLKKVQPVVCDSRDRRHRSLPAGGAGKLSYEGAVAGRGQPDKFNRLQSSTALSSSASGYFLSHGIRPIEGNCQPVTFRSYPIATCRRPSDIENPPPAPVPFWAPVPERPAEKATTPCLYRTRLAISLHYPYYPH